MAALSSSFVLLVLLFLTITVEPRPSPTRDEAQVLRSLFGTRLSSAILDPPSADDITEALARRPLPARRFGVGRGALRGVAGRSEGVPQALLDFLQQQSKMWRRGRSSVVGGRGCFGLKIDRIGSISGLGC